MVASVTWDNKLSLECFGYLNVQLIFKYWSAGEIYVTRIALFDARGVFIFLLQATAVRDIYKEY